MLSTAILLVGLGWQTVTLAAPSRWENLYGNALQFEVYRKGEPVGTYRQHFSGDDSNWQTQIEMQIEIPILFWHYRYRYWAQEQWQNDKLVALTVSIDRNGRLEEYRLTGEDIAELEQQTHAPLLPTHHYDARVLRQPSVFNTLSWRPNRIEVITGQEEAVQAAERTLRATRYRYSGELKDVEAWYDSQGRWVGLRFLDERGAPMELRCVRCGNHTYL